jgi:hypothetical protein
MARSNSGRVEYRRLACGLPWSTEHPLVFHVLTNVGEGAEAAAFLTEQVARGADLLPADLRNEDWSFGSEGCFAEVDCHAGDHQWLFMTPFEPYGGNACGGAMAVALAFDLGDVLRSGKAGWRPHDLIGLYQYIAEYSGGGSDDPDIGRLARWATITDRRLVGKLVRHGAAFEAARMKRDGVAARRVADLVRGLLKRKTEGYPADVPGEVVAQIGWMGSFDVEAVGTSRAWTPFAPEVLCGGVLPIRSARFWRDGRGLWHPMADLLR